MKKTTKWITVIFSLLLLSLAVTGCAQSSTPGTVALGEAGTIILRVNPEISIDYNKEGLVTKITGDNDDGKAIVDKYKDFVGKDAREVVKDMIVLIHEAGFFVSEIDGSAREITIELATGSVLPKEDYLNLLAEDVRDIARLLNLDTRINGETDYGDSRFDDLEMDSDYRKRPEGSISVEKAKEIALNAAGVTASNARFKK